jgi:hypothetical protein
MQSTTHYCRNQLSPSILEVAVPAAVLVETKALGSLAEGSVVVVRTARVGVVTAMAVALGVATMGAEAEEQRVPLMSEASLMNTQLFAPGLPGRGGSRCQLTESPRVT